MISFLIGAVLLVSVVITVWRFSVWLTDRVIGPAIARSRERNK